MLHGEKPELWEDWLRRVEGTGFKICLGDIGDKCQEEALLPDIKAELWNEFLSRQVGPCRFMAPQGTKVLLAEEKIKVQMERKARPEKWLW